MIRHWTRHLKTETDSAKRLKMMRSRIINAIGLSLTATVLVIVLITKFTHGAYIAIIAMAVLFLMMKGIRKHYDTVGREMAVDASDQLMLPARVHSIVLVSKLHKPTLRALAFAKAARCRPSGRPGTSRYRSSGSRRRTGRSLAPSCSTFETSGGSRHGM
jgi:hypothetical protein